MQEVTGSFHYLYPIHLIHISIPHTPISFPFPTLHAVEKEVRPNQIKRPKTARQYPIQRHAVKSDETTIPSHRDQLPV